MSSSFLVAALKSPNVKTRPFRMTSWALVCLPIFDMSIIDVFMKMFQQYVTTKPSCEILLMDHHGYMLQLGAIQDPMVATFVLIVLHFASSILLCDMSERYVVPTVGVQRPGQCLLPWDLVLTNHKIFPWQVQGFRHRHTRVTYQRVPAAGTRMSYGRLHHQI